MPCGMSVTNMNSVSTELVATLTVHILIDGKEILLDVFQNKDIAKGILIGGTDVDPRSVHALDKTIFLVAYSSSILGKEIGSTIEKINEQLGKPVVITCDEVTPAQLPWVIEHAC